MKKLLFLLPIISFALSACNPQKDKITDSPKESVALSASNFSTYVAVNTTVQQSNANYSDVTFFSYFIGADYCKFVDCFVTYKYVHGENSGGTEITVPLTLSGDGQAEPFVVTSMNRGMTYTLVVTSAKGTVHIYR